MNRRTVLLAAAMLPLARKAFAGPMDWFNGVKLGTELPTFDAEYLGPAPSSDRRLLLIDFWATWCAPCREEFPHLNDLNARLSGQGLAVIGLTQETRAIAEAFLPKVNINYLVGAGGANPLQKQLRIKALPYAILVDRKNMIVWRGQASSLTVAELEQRLKSAA